MKMIPHEKVVFNTNSQEDKVMLLSGGGSGHEPLHCGFVGNGMLDVGVAGHVFASPSTRQILAGIRSKPSKAGTLIIVKNYTGDILHFGLALERAKALGYTNIEMVIVADDVSVGKTKNGLVGRRGLAGTTLVHKILGAKSLTGAHLKSLAKLGTDVVNNLVTIGASLDHCSIPGRGGEDTEEVEFLLSNEVEIGMGIHNEPGVKKVSPIPTIDHLISELLKYLLSTEDKERNYVPFKSDDEVVLLINNLGGVSNLELYAITHHVFEQLGKTYKIVPKRVYTGAFTTSLNGEGFSITLLNASNIEDENVIDLLDAPTDAVGWNSNFSAWTSTEDIFVDENVTLEEEVSSDFKVDSKKYVEILKTGLQAVLDKEPEITRYDTIAGDGDCGETLSNGANAIISGIDSGKLETTDLVKSVIQITELVEDSMGGTSGGLYSIFLSSFAQNLRNSSSNDLPLSLKVALKSLFQYTKARVGDRTLIDALDPFVNTLYDSKGDFGKAVQAAVDGANSTRTLEAKFGRASYVDQDELKKEGGLPDPGAIGLAALFEGFYKAYK